MKFAAKATVYAIKESKGEYEGRAFSSTTFHMSVDLKENSSGRSMGVVTRPFKFGDASEFDKWAHLGHAFPIECQAEFEMAATREDGTALKLVGLTPVQRAQQARQPAPSAA